MRGFDLVFQFLQAVTGDDEHDSHTRKRQQVPQEGVPHYGIKPRTLASGNHRLRMLCAEPANRHVYDGDVHETEYRQRCRQGLSLAPHSETTKDQIADINQPQDKSRGESRLPSPPYAPHWLCPDGPGYQHDGTKHHANFGTRRRQCIGIEAALPKVSNRGEEIHEETDARHPGGGCVVVEDTLHIAHGLLSGSDKQGLVGAKAQQGKREDDEADTQVFHSALRTLSKRRRQTSVNTTS